MLLVTFNIYLLSQDIVCVEIYNGKNKEVNCVRNKPRVNKLINSFSLIINYLILKRNF